jgi:pyruvate/2-oxoglutarate dehydrogenase complex dihydrolipoamide acyltransferase (E2) component
MATVNDGRRPTVWIVLTVLFACAALGLGVWALSAQSAADDAEAKLSSQEQAAVAGPTAEPAATEAPVESATPVAAEADAETQQRYEDVRRELGQAGENIDQLQRELEHAVAGAEEAEQARKGAGGALDQAKAEGRAVQAQFEVTRTCLRGTLGALDEAFSSGGLEAAVIQLESLAGQCQSAASS